MRYCFILILLILASFNPGCHKETSCTSCNQPQPSNVNPVAKILGNTSIVLLTDSVILAGQTSYDPDGSIIGYSWRKITGPGLPLIANPQSAITTVNYLIQGVYVFELTVTDN